MGERGHPGSAGPAGEQGLPGAAGKEGAKVKKSSLSMIALPSVCAVFYLLALYFYFDHHHIITCMCLVIRATLEVKVLQGRTVQQV